MIHEYNFDVGKRFRYLHRHHLRETTKHYSYCVSSMVPPTGLRATMGLNTQPSQLQRLFNLSLTIKIESYNFILKSQNNLCAWRVFVMGSVIRESEMPVIQKYKTLA